MYSLQAIIRKNINCATYQFERLGQVANNVSNYQTKAYKTTKFEQMLREDGYLTGVLRTDARQGSLLVTNNPYDIAIQGHGYFPVISPDGEIQYTRDGSMIRGEGGYLMTADGWLVGDGIQIPANSYKFVINPNGDVYNYNYAGDEGQLIGRIPIVEFDSPESLEMGHNNKVVPTAESGEPRLIAEHSYIRQHQIEQSNTNVFDEVNEMLRLNASMIASLNLMKVADDMYNKAINIRE